VRTFKVKETKAMDDTFDFFISHASEDKAEIAAPLAQILRQRYRVWYDDFTLNVGIVLEQASIKDFKNHSTALLSLVIISLTKTGPKKNLLLFTT
jgi:hypothetical protein